MLPVYRDLGRVSMFCVIGLLVGAGATGCGESTEKACERIKALLPEAASIGTKEWTTVGKGFGAEDLKNQSLTLVLLTFGPRPKEMHDPKLEEEVKFFSDRPAEIVEAVEKSTSSGYVSIIQPEYVTDFTCAVEGTTGKGTVTFSAPKIYWAKVEYVARKVDGAWRIEEFHLPNHGWSTKLGKEGRWQATTPMPPGKK